MLKTIENTREKNKFNVVVIGYGNELRSDDGVGQRVADLVKTWELPNVYSLSVQQLTPEIVEILANVDIAIFVDAHSGIEQLQVSTLEPAYGAMTMGHISNPRMLLAIAQELYSSYPQTWLISIPAYNFFLGNYLSPVTEAGINDALRQIEYLIRIQQETTESFRNDC
jgi:hydrogenase maturation protease